MSLTLFDIKVGDLLVAEAHEGGHEGGALLWVIARNTNNLVRESNICHRIFYKKKYKVHLKPYSLTHSLLDMKSKFLYMEMNS